MKSLFVLGPSTEKFLKKALHLIFMIFALFDSAKDVCPLRFEKAYNRISIGTMSNYLDNCADRLRLQGFSNPMQPDAGAKRLVFFAFFLIHLADYVHTVRVVFACVLYYLELNRDGVKTTPKYSDKE